MQLLQTLTENEGVQAHLDSKQSEIMEACASFGEFPQQVKDHIMENLDQFIVPGDLQATYNHIVSFTENAVEGALVGLVDGIES